jgi:hypothetical protein
LVDQLVPRLLADNSDVGLYAVWGRGGVGKTCIAQAVALNKRVQERFPDGIVWQRVGRNPAKIEERIEEIAEKLNAGGDFTRFDPEAYRSLMSRRRVLLVLDDVWDFWHVQHLLLGAQARGTSRVLITSRKPDIFNRPDIAGFPVDILDKPTSRLFLARRWGFERGSAQLPETVCNGDFGGVFRVHPGACDGGRSALRQRADSMGENGKAVARTPGKFPQPPFAARVHGRAKHGYPWWVWPCYALRLHRGGNRGVASRLAGAIPVSDILLRGTILFRFPIQRSIKPQRNSVAPHLILLLVLRYQRPRQARFLHRLKTEKKHLKCELLLCRRHAKTTQNENCSKHIGLGGKYLVS